MRIAKITPRPNWMLTVMAEDGRAGNFDVRPYLKCEAFAPLKEHTEFIRVSNGGYFVEWDCGADLSADTIEAHWLEFSKSAQRETA